jgi:Outer membrane protein Omp28
MYPKPSILFSLILPLYLTSCREIPPIITPIEAISSENDLETANVLIEEFGGVRCVGCPAGHSLIKELKSIYKEKLVVISVHTGSFSIPYSENKFDYRLPENDQLISELGKPIGYPVASINRKIFDGESSRMLSPTQWPGYLAKVISQKTALKIEINPSYNAGLNTLSFTTNIKLTRDTILPNLYLSLMLAEDNIIDYQLTPTGKQPDYVHQNVVRSWFTPSSGILLSKISTKENLQFTFNLTLPVLWNTNNLRIIALIQKKELNNFDVLQVIEKKVK